MLLAIGIFLDSDKKMYSRDLGCNDYQGRAAEICRDFSREMDWTWLGHVLPAPGWRVTFDAVRRVYCKDRITLADMPALKDMASYHPFKPIDPRLEQGTVGLLTLLQTSPEGKASGLPDSAFDAHSGIVYGSEESSVFNPENPDYVLRKGCSGLESARN